jgi:Flp pilus assembly protein TadG
VRAWVARVRCAIEKTQYRRKNVDNRALSGVRRAFVCLEKTNDLDSNSREQYGSVGCFVVTNHHGFGRFRALFHEFCGARHGNLAVIFALAAIPVIGAVGAAVDLSKANDVKTQLQNALDAGVLAGVTQISSKQVSTASAVFTGDFTGKYSNTGSASFTQNANGSLSGTASSSVSMSFMAMLGKSTIVVSATATATPGAQSTTPVCILLTNTLATQALLVNSGGKLNAPTCEIHVLSTQSPAAIFNDTLNVKRICIKGSTIIKNGGASPPAETSCTPISDPFAATLPSVSAGTCTNPGNFSGNVTINPGIYCGTNFNGSGTLTLNPGLYVIKGTWNINSGWTVNGSGVTFYFADQKLVHPVQQQRDREPVGTDHWHLCQYPDVRTDRPQRQQPRVRWNDRLELHWPDLSAEPPGHHQLDLDGFEQRRDHGVLDPDPGPDQLDHRAGRAVDVGRERHGEHRLFVAVAWL